MATVIDGMLIFGTHDERTLAQLRQVADDPRVVFAAAMGDAHAGYSMPVGGVAAYRNAMTFPAASGRR
jgi:tRNA-splicing ligase RtcB (3'-phosphate/5'-hydroxy nucleic acid ligase)